MSRLYKLIDKMKKAEPKPHYDFSKDSRRAEVERKMVSIAERVKKEGICEK